MATLPGYLHDRYVKVGGINTRYWVAGIQGNPVILIHGLGASAEIWLHNIAALAKDHTVYVPDLPGFGYSEQPPPSFHPSDYAVFIDDFLKTLNVRTASLIGQSLGGGIALQYAIRFPQKVQRLVLVDCAGFGKYVRLTLKLMSLPTIGELVTYPTRLGVALFFKYAVRDPAVITEEFIDTYYKIFTQPGYQAFLLKITRMLIDVRGAKDEALVPVLGNLPNIRQPTLIIWGANDRVFPLQHAYAGREKIPRAGLYVMERCGHIPNLERPEEFNSEVLKFLGS
jgi:pimeloyl-ACP methyl ester carboxylesterase